MAPAPPPRYLGELRNPSSTTAQVEALKQLKHDLVGHQQRKEDAIHNGVVDLLAKILSNTSRALGKRRTSVAAEGTAAGGWSAEDEMRLQATVIIGSLAYAGRAFVAPLLAGHVLQPLFEALLPVEVAPRLLTETLKTIVAIADGCGVDIPAYGHGTNALRTRLLEQLYTRPVVESLAEVLSQTSHSPFVIHQVTLVATIFATTCREESHQFLCVRLGVLDHLASRVAAVAIASGYRPTGADTQTVASLPPAPPLPSLFVLLEAIGAIIRGSTYRTARFLYSTAILGVFPPARMWNPSQSETSQSHLDGFNVRQPCQAHNSIDQMLPQIVAVQSRSDFSRAFPALGSLTSSSDLSRLSAYGDSHLTTASRVVSSSEFESPLYTWLIYVARESSALDRMTVISVLSILRTLDESVPKDSWPDVNNRNRERTLSYLVVPLVCKTMEEADVPEAKQSKPFARQDAVAEHQKLLERAPLVLAELITHSPPLEKAAVDAKAIDRLCRILKRTFDPISISQKTAWSPYPKTGAQPDAPDSARMGRPGLPAELTHVLKCRESALRALAAISERDDQYRKLIIERGAVQCITDSLIPFPDGPNYRPDNPQEEVWPNVKDGNPTPVLIAACKAACSMSRSVSVLRTSLIDYGVAKPVFALLNHRDPDVQIAATDVLINMLLDFSPMREGLVEAGALQTLCHHAHADDPKITSQSLWALKHLVYGAPNDVRMGALEELGIGWLIKKVANDPREHALSASKATSSPIGMGTPNAAGEQVDLLNAVLAPSMEVDETVGDSDMEDEDTMGDSIGALHNSRPRRQTSSYGAQQRLKAIKEAEQNPQVRAYRDELKIQEHALDFIRNLMSSTDASHEMIDHLLQTFGQTRFFDIICSKLRPRATAHLGASPNHYNRPHTSSPLSTSHSQTRSPAREPASSFAHHQPPEILNATICILLHIANGKPSHRSLLLSQAHLLALINPLFTHFDSRVRTACVWLVNNLTWIDDTADQAPARERAARVREAGFEERVRVLLNDEVLDTRERAKTAVEQLSKLLEIHDRAGYRHDSGSPGGLGQFGQQGGMAGLGLGRHGHHGSWSDR